MKVRAGQRLLFLVDMDKLNGDDYVHLGDLQRLFREYAREMSRTAQDPAERQIDIVDMFTLLSRILPDMIKSVWTKPTKSALQTWGTESTGSDGGEAGHESSRTT